MASVNKVILIGNLTRDPEIRYTPKGMAVAEVGLAVNRKYRVENETREEVTFLDITFWGKQAEVVGQYMKKGKPIYIEGRLQLDTWDDKQTGQKRSKLRVVCEDFQFLGGKDSGGQGGGGGGGGYDEAPQSRPYQAKSSGATQPVPPGGDAFPPGLDEEDEIPF
ncbi:MAG TPA: single-stranded DNA-binding protein [Verrucomicrobiales bacterium]|jgi:single-strand DNA-binding protein|nr:single-stranded DNA-binding protein [Verrucomicrobiales bacterium]